MRNWSVEERCCITSQELGKTGVEHAEAAAGVFWGLARWLGGRGREGSVGVFCRTVFKEGLEGEETWWAHLDDDEGFFLTAKGVGVTVCCVCILYRYNLHNSNISHLCC